MSFYCWMEEPINISLMKLVDSVVRVFYILADFLLLYELLREDLGNNQQQLWIWLFLVVLLVLFHRFWSSAFGCNHIYSCHFIMKCPYICLVIFFVPRSFWYDSCSNFLLICVCIVYLFSTFYYLSAYVFIGKVDSYG